MDMNQYRELSIGMDDLFSRLFEASNNQAFPPYNLYRIEDNKFKVEMALAGYSKNDIEITIKDGLLVIKSSNKDCPNDTPFIFTNPSTIPFVS